MSNRTTVEISRKTVLFTIVALLVVALLYYLRDLILIVLSGIVVASFVEAGVKGLRSINMIPRFISTRPRHIPRGLAVGLVYSLIVIFLGVFFYIFIPAFARELTDFIGQIASSLPSSGGVDTSAFAGIQKLLQDISHNASLADILGRGQAIFIGLGDGFLQFFGSFFGGVVNLVLVFVISFFFAIREKGIQSFLRIVTPRQQEDYVVDLWERSEYKIGLWFQGQLLLGLIVGLIVYVALAILGVHYALLIAIMSAVFELVPFGFMISVIPAALFSFLDGGVKLAFITAIIFFVVQQIETYVLQPIIVKRTVGIPPLILIISLLVGSRLGGLWGIVLAIPLAVVLLEYISDIEKKKYIPIEHPKAHEHHE